MRENNQLKTPVSTLTKEISGMDFLYQSKDDYVEVPVL